MKYTDITDDNKTCPQHLAVKTTSSQTMGGIPNYANIEDNLYVSKNNHQQEVKPTNFFSTPLWYIEKDLPKGAYEWALDTEKNVEGREMSNRGGYQSIPLEITEFKYLDHLKSMMVFLPKFIFCNMWLNVNRKGDYNEKHTHPETDLACIWYITDNLDKLIIEDPMYFSRNSLFDAFNIGSSRVIHAEAGSLVMFPGDISHNVESHEEDTPRISLSFNIKFDHDDRFSRYTPHYKNTD